MTNPAIRELFMRPANPLRVQEAVLSLLAGDWFHGTPIYWSPRSFKVLYYAASLLYFRRGLGAGWRRRRTVKVATAGAPAEARS